MALFLNRLKKEQDYDQDFDQVSNPNFGINYLLDKWLSKVTEKKKKLILFLVGGLFIAFYLGAVLSQGWLVWTRKIDGYSFNPLIVLYHAADSFQLTFLCSIAIYVLFVRAVIVAGTKNVWDKKRNLMLSKLGTHGTAHEMTEEEEIQAFNRSKDINAFYDDIIGIDAKGYMCARKDKPFTNRNVAIVGASGSGKSISLIIPWILQNIRRGDSFIITDTKGDLYKNTAALARKAGYKVRILNLSPNFLGNSDGMNFLAMINGDEVRAETVCECIMINTKGDGKQDFWFLAGKNLLKAVVLYVSISSDIPDDEKNLAKVYDIIANNSAPQLENLFAGLRPGHPAYQPFNIFKNATQTIKDSAIHGLGVGLATLSIEKVKELVSHDEIDLIAPGYEKCAYYCVFSDQTKQFKFLSALFFAELFIALIDAADAEDSQSLPTRVNFIIDEFKACGAIPAFDDKISTVRSRNIGVAFVVQDITQLMRMYPDKAHVTILNNCTTQILLNSTDEGETLKHFSDLSGIETITDRGRGYIEAKTDIIKLHNQTNVRETQSKRNLKNIDELAHMPPDKMLVHIAGEPGIIMLTKQPYTSTYPGSKYKQYNKFTERDEFVHPMCEFMKKVIPAKHIPQWKKDELKNNPKPKKPIWKDVTNNTSPINTTGRGRQRRYNRV